jgi:hypothetical protein
MNLFSLFRFHILLFTFFFRLVHSQSFTKALSAYPQLSNFTDLLQSNPALATALLNVTKEQTILVPSNSAFSAYQSLSGQSIEALDPSTFQRIIQYHTLNATLKTGDLSGGASAGRGVVVSSQLVDSRYNRRGKWGDSNVKSPGQVVYITTASAKASRSLELVVRQGASTATVDAGAGASAKMDVVDGIWDGGVFQIVDQ